MTKEESFTKWLADMNFPDRVKPTAHEKWLMSLAWIAALDAPQSVQPAKAELTDDQLANIYQSVWNAQEDRARDAPVRVFPMVILFGRAVQAAVISKELK